MAKTLSPAALARALEAVGDISELLRLTQGAVSRARREASGDAYAVAERISQHLDYLGEVAELLRHELERKPADPQQVERLVASL
jgi:hypothetical protein